MASFATSYIPTVATTITRAADAASMTGTNFSSWYNQAQGSLYVEGQTSNGGPRAAGSNALIMASIDDGSSSNRLYISVTNVALNSYIRFVANNSSIFSATGPSITLGDYIKGGCSYNSGSSIGVVNSSYTTTSSLTFKFSPTRLGIGVSDGITGENLCGHIRKISYYPVALSSSNLVALTS